VRALAAVVGETGEERREVGVRRVLLEADRLAALPVLELAFVPFELDPLGCGLP
jgi:hypothetical protein